MDAAELRALQAPLKQKYREDAASARIVSRAVGEIVQGGIACVVRGHDGEVTAGLHEAAGGDGSQACSGDMLLEALVACAGVTLSAVATAMGVIVKRGSITAEGVWDARGTLAIDRAAPVGVTDISLRFDLDTDADEATVARLIQSTERYCVILQTLRNPPRIEAIRG
ncbi:MULTISPECIES: OsmC family protein [Acidiphilium]|uniref:OsmC family protein n=1 Tax=Acidiphilium TaxID=522 RepID=UPI0002144A72|nr:MULTISPECIES: OsmC family protein [Acidiphilium]EGO95029.1 OsmC family protein [Acidiphilium sp. PM]MBS3022883.1 OsmC family protein [Acidiphilium multivorum]